MAKPKSIEFVFPDRMLAYDCATCEAFCCKGHGFSLEVQKELVTILGAYPALGPFLSGDPNRGTHQVDNFSSGCHFLDSQNLCTIEREMGREMKPLLCRLFPLNKFFVYGHTVLVDVHNLCTLGVKAYSESSAQEIAYAPILEEFSETILATIERQPRDEHETKLEPFADDLLSLGRSIRDHANHYFDDGDFHGYLLFQSKQTEKTLPAGCDRRAVHSLLDRRAIRRMHEQMSQFFELRCAPLDEADELRLNRILIATSCSVRHRFLVGGASKIAGAQDFFRTVTLLPWILVALEFLYRSALSLNPARNVVATVNDICTKEFALLRALAMFSRMPVHTGALPKELNLLPAVQKPFFAFLRGLTDPSQASRPLTFYELLMSIELPVQDKAALLRALDLHSSEFVEWCPSRGTVPSRASKALNTLNRSRNDGESF